MQNWWGTGRVTKHGQQVISISNLIDGLRDSKLSVLKRLLQHKSQIIIRTEKARINLLMAKLTLYAVSNIVENITI